MKNRKRFVIYSALVGQYDFVLQPEVIDYRFDYILFSNEIKENTVGIWQVRPIAYHNDDNTRICRYVKTHPEELLPDYEVSVWMDSNVQILTNEIYEHAIELDNKNVLFSSMWHWNKCIYKEAFAVVNMMVEHEDVVVRWCHFLHKEQYPQHNGMCETNVMFRKHQKELTRKADDFWWWCIENYSRRDQLSFNYVLWKLNIPCDYFLGEGKNVRNTEHFRIIPHKNEKHNHCQIGKNEAWLMRYCWKDKSKTPEMEKLYYRLYSFTFPKFWFVLFGQLYRFKYLLEHLR